MVHITHDPNEIPARAYMAQLVNLDLADNYSYGYGATPAQACDDLKARVSDYIEYLQGADFTILGGAR
jgi:hypothetical protein